MPTLISTLIIHFFNKKQASRRPNFQFQKKIASLMPVLDFFKKYFVVSRDRISFRSEKTKSVGQQKSLYIIAVSLNKIAIKITTILIQDFV